MYDITIKAFSAEIKFYENELLVLCGTGYPDDHDQPISFNITGKSVEKVIFYSANITCKKKGKY